MEPAIDDLDDLMERAQRQRLAARACVHALSGLDGSGEGGPLSVFHAEHGRQDESTGTSERVGGSVEAAETEPSRSDDKTLLEAIEVACVATKWPGTYTRVRAHTDV